MYLSPRTGGPGFPTTSPLFVDLRSTFWFQQTGLWLEKEGPHRPKKLFKQVPPFFKDSKADRVWFIQGAKTLTMWLLSPVQKVVHSLQLQPSSIQVACSWHSTHMTGRPLPILAESTGEAVRARGDLQGLRSEYAVVLKQTIRL